MNAPCFKAMWFEEELSFQPFFWKTQVVVCVFGQSGISSLADAIFYEKGLIFFQTSICSISNLAQALKSAASDPCQSEAASAVWQQSAVWFQGGVVLVLLSVFFKHCSSIQVNPKQHQQSDRSLLSEHCSVSSLPSILLFHTHPLILQPECKCMLDKQNS